MPSVWLSKVCSDMKNSELRPARVTQHLDPHQICPLSSRMTIEVIFPRCTFTTLQPITLWLLLDLDLSECVWLLAHLLLPGRVVCTFPNAPTILRKESYPRQKRTRWHQSSFLSSTRAAFITSSPSNLILYRSGWIFLANLTGRYLTYLPIPDLSATYLPLLVHYSPLPI